MNYVSYIRLSKITEHDYKRRNHDESRDKFKKRFLTEELKGQKLLINDYVTKKHGFIISEFAEVQRASKNRPELHAAIRCCLENGCDLIVGNVDRLARDVYTGVTLKKIMSDKGLNVIFADNPTMSDMEFHFRVTFAQEELKKISDKQKLAYKASKKRYGNPNLLKPSYYEEMRKNAKKASDTNIEIAKSNIDNKKATAYIKMCFDAGLRNKSEISRQLNDNGYTTSKGKKFSCMSVYRLARRNEIRL